MYAPLKTLLAVLLLSLCFPIGAFAQEENQAPHLSTQDIEETKIALDGYDVVTYFLASAPQKGNKTYQAIYRDKRYLFASPENREKFAANPDKYLPEFDEYCGCAASEDELVQADPTVFKIREGKLILFENKDALSDWNENENERYQKAKRFLKYENEYDAGERLRDDTRVRLFTF